MNNLMVPLKVKKRKAIWDVVYPPNTWWKYYAQMEFARTAIKQIGSKRIKVNYE